MSIKRYALLTTALTGLWAGSSAQAQSAPAGDELNEIVVSGFRKSLETALEAKRNDDRVIDVISAEDIGKLPAENIAEAIQRVPGVQMQNINGRGSTISVRGLGPNFVSTTVDNQDMASPGFINGFRFDLIQPELANGIEVVKSPAADMDTGFLAGSINIKTVRPLDMKEPALVVSAKGQWSPFADDGATPKGAVSYVDQFYGGKLGIYLGAAYQELNDRADYAFIDRWFGDYTDPTGPGVLSPKSFRFRSIGRESKRTQLSATLEAKPTSDLDIALTGIYSRDQTAEDIRQQVFSLSSWGNISLPYNILQVSDRTATVIGGNAVVDDNRQIEMVDLKTQTLILDGKWTPTDKWLIKGAASYSEGTSYDNQAAAIASALISNFRLDTGDVDKIKFTSGTSLTDPSVYEPDRLVSAHYPDGSQTMSIVRKDSAQADARYFVEGVPALSALDAGIKIKQETFSQRETRTDRTTIGYAPAAYQPIWTASNPTVSNFLNGLDSFPTGWILPDISAYQSEMAREGVTIPVEFDPSNTFHIKRNIYSAYGKADIETSIGNLPIHGNIGMRLEQTQQSLGGYLYTDNPDPNATTPLATGSYKTSQHYFNALPSLNLVADIEPDLLLRVALAKVLERTSLDANSTNFATYVSKGVTGGLTTYTVQQGDAFLKPLTAKQADLSLEYYYGEGNSVSAAGFYKAIKNSTETNLVCPSSYDGVALSMVNSACMGSNGAQYDITTIGNNSATIELAGAEFSLEQSLDPILPVKGFGVVTNYTYVQQYAPENATRLHQLSKHTVNGTVYWADEQFSARLSANYRSSYYQNGYNESFFARQGHTINGRTQLDLVLGYNVDDKLSFTMTGQNINYAPIETAYQGLNSRWQESAYAGAVYTIGMTYKFF